MPGVSSLLNWFSPPPKEATIRGRSLNLTSGKSRILLDFAGKGRYLVLGVVAGRIRASDSSSGG